MSIPKEHCSYDRKGRIVTQIMHGKVFSENKPLLNFNFPLKHRIHLHFCIPSFFLTSAAAMGKDNIKRLSKPPRHDPLHVEMSERVDVSGIRRKAPRQKFVDRNNRADEEIEVRAETPS